jgi:ubiquinone/menaquinone biosynthesis C-methylase UbiE
MTFQTEEIYSITKEILLEQFGRRSNEENAVLDVGCGPGYYVRLMAELGYRVYGTDFSLGQLAWAKRLSQGENRDYVSSNIYHLPYPTGFFNLLLCLNLFQNITREDLAAGELARVLSPHNGRLFLVALNKYSLASPRPLAWLLAALLFKNGQTPHPPVKILHRSTPSGLKRSLTKAGFTSVRIRFLFVFPRVLQPLARFLNRTKALARLLFPLANQLLVEANKNPL